MDQPAPKEGIGIDPGISAVTTVAPVASMEDFLPQVIFKFHFPSSLDYGAFHRLPIKGLLFASLDLFHKVMDTLKDVFDLKLVP